MPHRVISEWNNASTLPHSKRHNHPELDKRFKLPAKARRKLQRLITFATKATTAFANIPSELCNAAPLSSFQLNECQAIIDAGAAHLIARDENRCESIDDQKKVNVRGANGLPKGRRGISKDNTLGSQLKAARFPELPVEGLISTQVLKTTNWATLSEPGGDHL